MPAPLETSVIQSAAVAFRVAGALTFMPFFGSVAIPVRVKAVITLVLTALLVPLVHVPPIDLSPGQMASVVLGEALLGLSMGLCLQIAFEAVQLAGQIGGFQLSFTLVNVIDPQTNVDTPVLANFHQLLVLLIFLQLNVHHWILRAVEGSFARVPPGAFAVGKTTLNTMMAATTEMWRAGLQLAAPLLLATLILDVTVGFISKAAPQIPALFLSIPLKNLTGYAVLALALSVWPSFFEREFARALGWSWGILGSAR